MISAALELVTVFYWLPETRPTYCSIGTSSQLILTVPHLSFSWRARAWGPNQKKIPCNFSAVNYRQLSTHQQLYPPLRAFPIRPEDHS